MNTVKGAPLCAYLFCDCFRSTMCDCDACAWSKCTIFMHFWNFSRNRLASLKVR